MKSITLLCLLLSFTVLIGCSEPAEDMSMIVDEHIELAAAISPPAPIPRYLPDGEVYATDVIGFEASDGTMYPVIPASLPNPRGGSISPIHIEGKVIKVLRGRNPNAAENEVLGVFIAEESLDEVNVTLSISGEGALRLALQEAGTDRPIPISRSTES